MSTPAEREAALKDALLNATRRAASTGHLLNLLYHPLPEAAQPHGLVVRVALETGFALGRSAGEGHPALARRIEQLLKEEREAWQDEFAERTLAALPSEPKRAGEAA